MKTPAHDCCLRAGLSFAALLTLSPAAPAQEDGAALVEQARCYACHHLTQTLLGPPYQAIAARHAARRSVMIGVLASKIVAGGGGNWGLVPMVPNEHVSMAEARAMAEWILELVPPSTAAAD